LVRLLGENCEATPVHRALGSAAAVRPLGARAENPIERILYFTYSAGYRHDVLTLSTAILTQLGKNSGAFEVTATEDPSEFSPENLDRYSAVMFYTSGELPMNGAQKAALLKFVRSGRGFLGVHSATDTFYTWPDYLDLLAATLMAILGIGRDHRGG